MKSLATSDPARATELLNQAPQLSYAVFQALLLMGLVSPEAINSVMENPVGGGGPLAPPPAAVPPQQAAMPGGFAFPAPYAQTPPVATSGYAPPPPPQVQQVPAPAPAPAGQDPAAVLQQVLALPQEVVDQLPELERSQIMAIRAQYGAR